MSLLKASGKLLKVFAPKLAWDTYGYLLLLYSKEIWRIGKIKLQHWGFLNNLNTSNWFAIETVPGGRTQSGTILQLPHVPSTSWKRMRNWRYLLRMGWEEWSSLLGLFCFCATQDWRGCWEGNTTLQPIYFAVDHCHCESRYCLGTRRVWKRCAHQVCKHVAQSWLCGHPLLGGLSFRGFLLSSAKLFTPFLYATRQLILEEGGSLLCHFPGKRTLCIGAWSSLPRVYKELVWEESLGSLLAQAKQQIFHCYLASPHLSHL